MPDVDPAVPPPAWRLGARGRAAAAGLRLPPGADLVASDEPKAGETLSWATGRPVRADPGFAEVRREHAWRPDHREMARAYVDGADHHGWEPRAVVVARFDQALRRAAVNPAVASRDFTGAGRDPAAAGLMAADAGRIDAGRDAAGAGPDLVVGTHGMAMTCWLAAHGHLTTTPGAFWSALTFPDVVEVRYPTLWTSGMG